VASHTYVRKVPNARCFLSKVRESATIQDDPRRSGFLNQSGKAVSALKKLRSKDVRCLSLAERLADNSRVETAPCDDWSDGMLETSQGSLKQKFAIKKNLG
jgi:hypothetical protein